MVPASMEEVAGKAHELYESRIRSIVESRHRGEFLVIDVDSGEYEVDGDDLAASERARRKHPAGRRFLMRIGSPTAFKIGAGASPD